MTQAANLFLAFETLEAAARRGGGSGGAGGGAAADAPRCGDFFFSDHDFASRSLLHCIPAARSRGAAPPCRSESAEPQGLRF